MKVAQDLRQNFNFGVEELQKSFEELVRRPVLADKTVEAILPVLKANALIYENFKLASEPKAIVSSVGSRIFELEGITEPWVAERIDYMRDDR